MGHSVPAAELITAMLPPAIEVDESLVGGRYRLIRELGGGGMGTVFEADDTVGGGVVAVKVMKPSSGWDAVVRFHREAQIASQASTRHVVQVLDAGSDTASERHYLVMERLYGEDVSQLVDRVGPLPAQLALRIAIQACTGLSCAHRGGAIHRDIKPANLFLSRELDHIVVKVLDFGAAKVSHALGPALTSPGTLIGSPHYMSPEQAKGGAVDLRADIWGLGVVLYKLLTGRVPFAHVSSFGKLIFSLFTEDVPPIRDVAPHLPRAVGLAVHRALHRDPARRFASADEMAHALLPLAGGTGIIAASDVPSPPVGYGDTVPCEPISCDPLPSAPVASVREADTEA